MVILFVDGPDNIENRKPPLVLFFVQDGADLKVFIEPYRNLIAHLPLYLFANPDIKIFTVTHTLAHSFIQLHVGSTCFSYTLAPHGRRPQFKQSIVQDLHIS